ncbi:MAG: GspH/FimT family pseudopilin [Defluviitaleaceae bacterium]|nr:GspH/FimT family pseudopilin [Defluviitaleaceae bacterium]
MIARTGRNNGGFTLLELVIALAIIVVISSGIFLAFRQPSRTALDQAMLQLQADMRYAQRMAVISGQQHAIHFDRANNMYRIMSLYPDNEIRRVYLQDGVELTYSTARLDHTIAFHPRGTATTAFRVRFAGGGYTRDITATLGAGRIEMHNAVPLQ